MLSVVTQFADTSESLPIGLDSELRESVLYFLYINCFSSFTDEVHRAVNIRLRPYDRLEEYFVAVRRREPSQGFFVQEENA